MSLHRSKKKHGRKTTQPRARLVDHSSGGIIGVPWDKDKIVTIFDKSQNLMSTVTVKVELGIGNTVTKSNKSQNPLDIESDK